MGKLIKWLLIAAGVLVTLVVVAVVAVALLFDPDDYRDELADALSEATGRVVQVDGPLSLTLFPWLAIDTGRISVANATAFGPGPMLELESASAAVRFAPLLSGKIEVGNVVVDGLSADLAVRGDGVASWDDILEKFSEGDADVPVETQSADSEPLDIAVESIEIINASVRYVENRSGDAYTLENVNFTAGSVDMSKPIALSGSLQFDASAQDMRGDVAFDATAKLDADDVALSALRLQGTVAGAAFAGEQAFSVSSDMLALNQTDNTLDVNGGAFTFGPLRGAFELGGSGPSDPLSLRGTMSVDTFQMRALTDALNMEPILTADASVLQAISFDSDIAMTFESVQLSNAKARIDDTGIEGTVAIANFASGRITFELAGDDINLDRYLPPAEDAEIAADASDALAETALPVDLLRGLNASGTLQFGKLTMGDLPFTNLRVGLNVANDKARLKPIAATVLNGQYEGDVQIDASGATPTLSLNESVEGLDIGALASLLFERDNIEGTLAGQFRLNGRGETLADIRSTLAGDVRLALSDGVLTGTDLWYEIRRARALFKRETPPEAPAERQTKFTNLSGTAVVKDGVATNDDLFAELPFLHLNGAGAVNLADATVDYGLNARVLERPDFLTGASAEELDAYTEAVIPLKITGDLAAPSIAPDIEGMVRAAAKEKIDAEKDRLKRRLLDELTGGDEEDEEEDVEDKLKNRLKDLFDG
ncbi:MAG: AsmA family protein [Pseudomonadota bacterium]